MKKSAKILVIDDDVRVQKAIRLTLEDEGYDVTVVGTGEQAVQIFSPGAFHLIFLDLKMPGMGGVETLKQIRKIDTDVMVYIVTAFHSEFFDQLKQAAADGIGFELLRKPVSGDVLCTIAEMANRDGSAS